MQVTTVKYVYPSVVTTIKYMYPNVGNYNEIRVSKCR